MRGPWRCVEALNKQKNYVANNDDDDDTLINIVLHKHKIVSLDKQEHMQPHTKNINSKHARKKKILKPPFFPVARGLW